MKNIKKKNFYEVLTSANAVLIYLSVFKFLLLLIFAGNYGLFRDEYYYVACSKHLAWGYVDQPPFSELMLLISRTIFGDSLFGIRIFAYLAGSVLIYVAGLIAREMGGNKYAQGLTGFTVLFCAVALGTTSYFSMNSFDLLFSALMFYYLVKLLKSGDAKYWYDLRHRSDE
jgi:dolichyl-phosphate-mannose--protein O-mannosyl transferase